MAPTGPRGSSTKCFASDVLVRVLYFGTYDRAYPRNAQVISALRAAGADVREEHRAVWEQRHNWSAGPRQLLRLANAERSLRRCRDDGWGADALIVGYPGHFDLGAARHVARGRPVVFNPLVSLADTLVDDRARFRPGSPGARVVRHVDQRAFRQADVVVADTKAQAQFFRDRFGLGEAAVEVCLVGAEDRLFRPGWQPTEPFHALFVGKLIPLHGLETILAAAALAPEIPFRVVGERAARAAPNRPADERDLPAVGRVRESSCRDPRRGMRSRHLRCGREGCARDSEQGVPGPRVWCAARHRRHARRTRVAERRR